MTIPTQLTQGATTHIKDGLPVTTVSNLGMLTPAAEALIMAIKAGLETVASTLDVTLPTVAETAAQLNETTAIAHANTTANQQNAADIAALSASTTQAVNDLQSSISSLESSISAKIAENVVTAATVEMTNTGQVKLNVDKKNLSTGATSTSFTTIPVASAGSNGIMPKESYQAINDLQSRVSSLESGGVWRATFATYQALTTAYPDLDVSSTTWTANDYVEVESDSNYDDDPTRYVVVVNGQVKTLVFQKRMQAAVQIATTSATGVVLGSADTAANKYKIFVENDGSMDLIGADDIEANLSVAVPYSSVVGESVSQYKIVEKDGLLFRANSAILEVPAVFDPDDWTQVGGRDMELDEVTISKNVDDELQAIGVIEKNRGNTKYDWVGTYQEWLDQDVAEEHPEWICYVTDDATDLLFANDIFDFKRTDRLLDSLYWVRADDFAWHDGEKYNAMYQHLLDDWNNGTLQTETVNGHTFNYMLAPDKHKLFSTNGDGEEIAQTLFEETGIAWYYIIDLNSPRFKLPRNSFDFVGYRTGAGNYVNESLPNIKASISNRSLGNSASNGIYAATGSFTTSDFTTASSVYYASSSGSTTSRKVAFDASLSSSAYQDNAPVQQRAVETFLYFFTGNYTKDAITQAAYINGEMFDGKANTNLNNLEDSGKNIANWSSNMTNCLIELPQDIEVEANNGIITAKAGSKVYVPNKFEEDGVTPKFDEVIITEDVSWIPSVTAKVRLGMYRASNMLDGIASDFIYSGDTSKMSSTTAYTYARFYNTDTNRIYAGDSDGGNWVEINDSLPFCVFENDSSGAVASISKDQIFNGLGYLGATAFVLPGVKGLIPDEWNPDGSLKSIAFTTNSVLTRTYNAQYDDYKLALNASHLGIYVSNPVDRLEYKERENINYNNNTGLAEHIAHIGFISCDGTRITSFKPKTVFHAVDANEADYVVSFQRPTAANNYTWYRLYKSGWIEQGGQISTVAGYQSITLPKKMADYNYSVMVSRRSDMSTNAIAVWGRGPLYTQSTTAISVYSASSTGVFWEVKGFAKV